MAMKFEIKKFNGNNFSMWKLKMKAILRKDKCLAAIGERPAAWDEMDENAIANLHLALADEVLSSIEEKKSAKDIWDHLARLYEARSLHNKKTESTSVTEHVNNLNTLFSQLTSLSCKIDSQERAEILLQSLPDSYDQVIINLTSNVLTDYLVFDDVAAAILEEENRRNNWEDRQTSSRQVEALVVKRGRSMEPGSSGSHNHGKSKTGKKKNFKCFKCGKPGHFRKDFRGSNTSYPQGNATSTSEDGNALCCEAAIANKSRKRFADVCCNDHELKIIGIGCIMVKMHDGMVRTIRDVQHLKGEIIEEAKALVASHSPSHVVAVTWHQKLGHMSEQGMKILVKRNLLPGLTKVSLPFYEHCVISKQRHLKFKTLNSRSVYVLELVHSDVWRCWVYLIKKKSDVFEVFNVYKARVELDSGKKIKCLRTDNKVELKTPMEMWTGKPVNYSDLHIFGSLVYVMYNSQETTKLDPKSRKCLFLGYADGVKGYRLWDPTAHKVVISRNFVFMEDKVQENEKGDSTTKETASIQMEKEFQSNDSSKAVPQHEEGEPSILQEVLNNLDASFWKEAMQKEIEALHKNKTWEFVPLPGGRKPIRNK
ncbi:gag-pol polyprotein [Tanacetum coccineum]